MTSGISNLMNSPIFCTRELTNHSCMWYVGITRSKRNHVLKKILFGKSPNNITLLISFLIQKCKMRNTFCSKFIKFLFPFRIVNIQHDKVDTVPERRAQGKQFTLQSNKPRYGKVISVHNCIFFLAEIHNCILVLD
jgi:hypothetical protein